MDQPSVEDKEIFKILTITLEMLTAYMKKKHVKS